jgi:hypothetical protein
MIVVNNCRIFFGGGSKNPIKIDGQNHHTKDKREDQRKAKRHTTHKNQRREKASPFRGRKITLARYVCSRPIII